MAIERSSARMGVRAVGGEYEEEEAGDEGSVDNVMAVMEVKGSDGWEFTSEGWEFTRKGGGRAPGSVGN